MSQPNLSPSRLADRSTTEAGQIREVLEDLLFCTVSCCLKGKPMALPTGFCLLEDQLMIHGSVKSHFLGKILEVGEVCITAFDFQSLVLAPSAFHHSVNYRSVVLFGKPTEITDPEAKAQALEAYTERYIPGRWPTLRPMTDGELKATKVIAFPLDQASLKQRTGPPAYERGEEALGIWTGLLPVSLEWQEPIPDSKMKPGTPLPDHLKHLAQ